MFILLDAPNYAIEELCDRLDTLLENNFTDEDFENFIRFCRKVINESKSNINTINYNFTYSGNEKFVKLEWEKIYNLLELNFDEYLTKTTNYFSDFSFSFPYNKEKVDKLLKDWKENYNLPTSVYNQLNKLSTLNYLVDEAIVNIYVKDINGLVAKKITEVFEEYKLMKELDVWEEKGSSIKTINFVYDKSKFDQLFSNIKDYNINKISTYLNKYKDGEKVLIRFSNMPLKVLDNLTNYLLDFEIKVISSGIADVQGYDIEFEHGFFPKPNLYEFVSLNGKNKTNPKTFKLRYDKNKLNHFVDFVNKDIKESDRSDKYYSGFLNFANLIKDNLLIPDKDNIVEIAIYDDESRNNLIKLLQLSGFEIIKDNSFVKLTDEGMCISGKNIIVDNCETFNQVLDRDMNRIYNSNENKEDLHEKAESMQAEDLENSEDLVEINVKLPEDLNTTYSANGRQMYKAELSEEEKALNKESIGKIVNNILEKKETRGSFKGAFKRENAEFNLERKNKEIVEEGKKLQMLQSILNGEQYKNLMENDFKSSVYQHLKTIEQKDKNSVQELKSHEILQKNLQKINEQNDRNKQKLSEIKNVLSNKFTDDGTLSRELNKVMEKQINTITIDNTSAFLNNMTLTDSALKDKANKNNLNSQILQQAINISNEIKQEEKDLSMNDMLRKSSIRVASVQSTNLISNLLVSIIDRKFDSDTAKSFGIFLESEAGKSFISIIVGNLLRHVPQLKNHKNSQEFSEEFNVAGMSQLGNYIIDEHILGLLSGLTSVLDSVDKVRVQEDAHQISEQEFLEPEAQELLKTNIK